MAIQPVVIVTGASSGIGAATARYFGARDWAVVLAARSEEQLKEIADEIVQGGGTALAVPTDVTVIEEVRHLVSETLRVYGRVDALINNAGMGMSGSISTVALDDLDYLFRLNILAPVAAMQAVVPIMRYQGEGVIVNVSSFVENLTVPYVGGYGASKAALGYLSDAAAVELDQEGIAVVKVQPGLTATGFERNLMESGAGMSIEELLAQASFVKPMPVHRVAEAIWMAVQTRSSQQCLRLSDRLMCFAGRFAPGLVNNLLKKAAKRYVQPAGAPAQPNLGRDLRRARRGVGFIAAGLTLLVGGLWLRGKVKKLIG